MYMCHLNIFAVSYIFTLELKNLVRLFEVFPSLWHPHTVWECEDVMKLLSEGMCDFQDTQA